MRKFSRGSINWELKLVNAEISKRERERERERRFPCVIEKNLGGRINSNFDP